jgi:Holliday junction resolvase RusA-like endonuclease
MTSLAFSVPGLPQPKQRPRVDGRNGRIYTPKKTGVFEQTLKVHAMRAIMLHRWPPRFEGPVAVWLHVYFPDARPRDIDNAAKSALDGANEVVWKDDSQVHELHVYRRIDRAKPRLEFRVEPLAQGGSHDDRDSAAPHRRLHPSPAEETET